MSTDIHIRIDKKDYELIKKEAKKMRLTVSAYIRMVVIEYIRRKYEKIHQS